MKPVKKRSTLEAYPRSWEPFSNYRLGPLFLLILLSTVLDGVICHENGVEGNGRQDPESGVYLSIVPAAKNRVYQRALGKSSVFTCTANVDDPQRLNDFRWWWPDGRAIEATDARSGNFYDDTRVEIMRDQPGSLTLLFTAIQEQDLGTYRCTATYANSQQLHTDFTLRAFVPITFEDAPTNQYAVKGKDYKVRCRVRADPEPQVDWKKDHRMINNSDRFVIHKDGVVIRAVTEADEGVYTCRVRVTSMGIVEEKYIQVEVYERPRLTSVQEIVEGVESDNITLQCSASGKPPPRFEWDDEFNVSSIGMGMHISDRFTIDSYRGTLQIERIKKKDAGTYTCTARNDAGNVTMKTILKVITKPVIDEFANITTQAASDAILTCRASGDPAPDIKIIKIGNYEPFHVGAQRDTRIFLDLRKEPGVTTATLKISDVMRTDDGLYKCLAYNHRIQVDQTGHMMVEFPPTFLLTPTREAWSWDKRPVNISCFAEGIPNATIAWFMEKASDMAVDPYTPHVRQIGFVSTSVLEIKPVDRFLYGNYKCVATNKLGSAEHRIHLRQARKPGPILEAIVHEKTATSIAYKIVGPVEDGGIPIKYFVAQYKEEGQTWQENSLKMWPVDRQIFVIEGLKETRKYFIRFAAENEVGLGDWALEREETTPRRSPPQPPLILNPMNDDGHFAITAYPDRFELFWKSPPDNGDKIDHFEITFTPVRNLTVYRGLPYHKWDPIGKNTTEKKPFGKDSRHILKNLVPDTFYRVEITAKNPIGSSTPASIIFKTAPLPGDQLRALRSPVPPSSTSSKIHLTLSTLIFSSSVISTMSTVILLLS